MWMEWSDSRRATPCRRPVRLTAFLPCPADGASPAGLAVHTLAAKEPANEPLNVLVVSCPRGQNAHHLPIDIHGVGIVPCP